MSTSTSNSIPLTTLIAPATTSQCSPQTLAHVPGHNLPGSANTGSTSIPPASSNPHAPPTSNPTSTSSPASQNQTTPVPRRALKDWITSNRANLGLAVVALGLVIAGYVAQIRANNIAARGNDITSQAYLEQVWKDCRDRTDIWNTTTCRNLQNTSFDSIVTVKSTKRSMFDARQSFIIPQEINGNSSARISGIPRLNTADPDPDHMLIVSSMPLTDWMRTISLIPIIGAVILNCVTDTEMKYNMRRTRHQLDREIVAVSMAYPTGKRSITGVKLWERTRVSQLFHPMTVLVIMQMLGLFLANRVDFEILVYLICAVSLLGPIVAIMIWKHFAWQMRLIWPGGLDEEVSLPYKVGKHGHISVSESTLKLMATVPVATVPALRKRKSFMH